MGFHGDFRAKDGDPLGTVHQLAAQVPLGWNPAMTTWVSFFQRLYLRWWRMRPPVHMPLPAMMMAPPSTRLRAMESSVVSE